MNNIEATKKRIAGMEWEIESRKRELEALQIKRKILLRRVGRQRLIEIQEKKPCLHL